MSDVKYPHVQAAFINAIREEGTKAEACDTLQALWNERCAQAAELTRLRARVAAADKLAAVYWILRSYAVHDDDCTFNRPPHYRGCSCGLKDALDKGEATIRVFQPPPAAPTDYEIKLAQLKKDFPNGI